MSNITIELTSTELRQLKIIIENVLFKNSYDKYDPSIKRLIEIKKKLEIESVRG